AGAGGGGADQPSDGIQGGLDRSNPFFPGRHISNDDRQADIRKVMMKVVTCVFASLLTMGAAFEAGAHAFLDHATRAVGSAIHSSPAQVRLWFTEKLEPAFSTVQVQDRDGRRVDKQDKRVDPADRKSVG